MAKESPSVTDLDLHLFNEGRHLRAYESLGGHVLDGDRAHFAVWAPNASDVSVCHDANGWQPGVDRLEPQASSGIWSGTLSGVGAGTKYKFCLETPSGQLQKADPFAFATECPPLTASVLSSLTFDWSDESWAAQRPIRQWLGAPISIYEIHLGSWRRRPDGSFCSYLEIAEPLVEHVHAMGFTHVELMPVMEHPFFGSWGYQTTSYFAPTARYGSPEELMALIDYLHQSGIGVILDWVPSHLAVDEFALARFDGTHLFEHADPSRGVHPDWGSYEFNYARNEVRSFLLSSACFWLDRYHADGLRVDGVASMLYLDYSRKAGQWTPNRFGGREDLEAVSLLKEVTLAAKQTSPGALTIAEESTAWPGVTRPVEEGGLGFDLKWDLGWMHDTLGHLARDPIYRRHHYDELTFRALYAFSECYVLPLSHDEVVHGKGSLAAKMPGDDWRRRANLRLLFAYEWLLPGKKLLFMGGELATWHEWNHEHELEWSLLNHPAHAGVARLVADCNACYRIHPGLHGGDCSPSGFTWIEAGARDDGILAWLRHAPGHASLLCVANFTPVERTRRLGVSGSGHWQEILNSDALDYGGSGVGNLGGLEAQPIEWSGQPASLEVVIGPLAAVCFVGPGGAGG